MPKESHVWNGNLQFWDAWCPASQVIHDIWKPWGFPNIMDLNHGWGHPVRTIDRWTFPIASLLCWLPLVAVSYWPAWPAQAACEHQARWSRVYPFWDEKNVGVDQYPLLDSLSSTSINHYQILSTIIDFISHFWPLLRHDYNPYQHLPSTVYHYQAL